MKLRIVVVIVVPLLCIGICWGAAAFTQHVTGLMADKLVLVKGALDVKDWESAGKLAQEMVTLWEEQGVMVHAIIYHRDSQELALALGGLTASIEAEEESEARIMLAHTAIWLDRLAALDALSLENLF